MSGIIGGAGSKSGVIGEIGLGLSNVTTFILNGNFGTDATTITGWNVHGNAMHHGASIGTLVSESSGIFTMPSTGVWQVHAVMYGHHENDDNWLGYSFKRNGAIMSDVWCGTAGAGEMNFDKQSVVPFNWAFNVTALSDNFNLHSFSVGAGSFFRGVSGWNAVGEMHSTITWSKLGNLN